LLRRADACAGEGVAGDQAGQHTLIAAPTGSGKTLAAFLAAIDDLIARDWMDISPTRPRSFMCRRSKALSNDIHRNLEVPLAGIREHLRRSGLPAVEIRTWCGRAIRHRRNASGCAAVRPISW